MSKIYKGVSELIGKTPIIEAVNFEKAVEADATILAKLEYFNPAGSVKDRVAPRAAITQPRLPPPRSIPR